MGKVINHVTGDILISLRAIVMPVVKRDTVLEDNITTLGNTLST